MNPATAMLLREVLVFGIKAGLDLVRNGQMTEAELDDLYNQEKIAFSQNRPGDLPDPE